MLETVKLTGEDFAKSRPLALAGFVIGQEISQEEYDKYMSEGSSEATASEPTVESEDSVGEESPTKDADEAAKERDAMSAAETEAEEGEPSPTKEAEEAAKEQDSESQDSE